VARTRPQLAPRPAGSLTLSRAQALAGVAATAATFGSRAAAQSTRLRICGFPVDSYAAPYYALDQGFLARNGIDLEIVTLASAGGVAEAILANAIDIGMGDPLQVANPFVANVPLALFGGSGLYSSDAPASILMVDKNSAFQKPKDLEGQAIGVVALASLTALGVREWLGQNHVDLTNVKIIEIPTAAMPAALARGTLAAAVLIEPFLSMSRDVVRPIGKPLDAIAGSFYLSSFYATTTWLGANRDVVKRFLKAMYDAQRWANTHHDESAPILAKYAKLDPSRTSAMTRIRYATSLDPVRVQPVLDVAYKWKQLARAVTAKDITFPI
jgi:NitT/TauT family transport system substrate-binding protein